MVRHSAQLRLLFALLTAVLSCGVACGSRIQTAGPVITPKVPADHASVPPPPTAVEPPPADPVVTLIALSDRHFQAGQKELELGHVGGAKKEFDEAIGVLMESSYGGRSEPRIREHFDRLVDRISAYEIKALAAGDGFTEKRYEPASIDELLALSATFTDPSSTPELADTVAADLETVGYDVPIPFNQKVLSYIELFQGRLHDFIQEGLTRGSKYLPMIQSVFRAEGLPLDLAYIPLIESAFKANALSRAQAKGVWQFMRGTGIENGLRHDWYIDERSDPEKATVAAAKYLSTLSKMFEGDWHLALASYNGGPGRVQRAMKRGRASDFWRLSAAKANLLPRETREYVPMILAAVVIARNPAQYGFEFSPDPLPSYQLVTLPGPVDLRRVAEWIDTSIDEIQALNPELRRWTTPVRDTSYALKVPVGAAEIVSARLEEADTTDLASLKWHTVRKGETLATIARSLRVSRTDLAEANYLKTTSRVATGQKLMVPHEATVLMAARADRPVPVAESREITTAAVVPAMASSNAERVKVMYQVKRGDTLASIARAFRTTVASLRTWNRIPGSTIRAGERLTVYALRGV